MVAAASSRAAPSLTDARSHLSRTRLLERASARAALSIRATRSRGSETLILIRDVGIPSILLFFLLKCPPPRNGLELPGQSRLDPPEALPGRPQVHAQREEVVHLRDRV